MFPPTHAERDCNIFGELIHFTTSSMHVGHVGLRDRVESVRKGNRPRTHMCLSMSLRDFLKTFFLFCFVSGAIQKPQGFHVATPTPQQGDAIWVDGLKPRQIWNSLCQAYSTAFITMASIVTKVRLSSALLCSGKSITPLHFL